MNEDIFSDIDLPPYRILRAGDLSCMYEAGNLRYIKYGDVEIIRMIYGAVRDLNWKTIARDIIDESIEEKEDGFIIRYTAIYKENEINYSAGFYIEGKPGNSIIFSMKGSALSKFKKNRIGICVLHPLKECCGKEAGITKPGGETYQGSFPELIAPHQAFKDVQQMEWAPAKDLHARLIFQGDIFETEDQRNWSDSSFKTYSTPLELPFPALVKTGDTIEQHVILQITGNMQASVKTTAAVGKTAMVYPHIGYAKNSETFAGKAGIQLFEQYPFHHYRVEIDMSSNTSNKALHTAFEEAFLLNTKLELILFFSEDYKAQLNLFLRSTESFHQHMYAVLLLQHNCKVTPAALMKFGYNCIKQQYPALLIGYGTDANFAELNRNRPGELPHDFVSFSLTPQVHLADKRSIIENLECQPDIIKTIRSFTGKAIHVSPVSFSMRESFEAISKKKSITNTISLLPGNFEKKWLEHCLHKLKEAESISFYK